MHALPLSTMRGDPAAATRALLALAQARWERHRELNDRERRDEVLAALNAGLTLQEVADAMELSIARVSQIRDDTR